MMSATISIGAMKRYMLHAARFHRGQFVVVGELTRREEAGKKDRNGRQSLTISGVNAY